MVYTIGYKPAYQRGMAEHGKDFMKLGRTPTYNGGCVWKTATEAWAYILSQGARLKKYSVWKIDADWEKDTEPNVEGAPWHDLLITSRIMREIALEPDIINVYKHKEDGL